MRGIAMKTGSHCHTFQMQLIRMPIRKTTKSPSISAVTRLRISSAMGVLRIGSAGDYPTRAPDVGPARTWHGARGRLGRLRRHRPDGDEVCDEDERDEAGDDSRGERRRLPAPAHPPDRDAPDHQGDQQEQGAEVADAIADPDPGEVGVGQPLLVGDPLRPDPEDDVAGEGGVEEGQVGGPDEPGGAAPPRDDQEDGRQRQGSDEHHRAGDVEEEREEPGVRADDCEHAHAPGFQSMTTSRRVNQRTRIQWAKSVRRSTATAESSPAGCTPRLAWAPDPVARNQRTSATMIQPSKMSYSGRLSASQMPNTSVPRPPTPQRISPISRAVRLTGLPITNALYITIAMARKKAERT